MPAHPLIGGGGGGVGGDGDGGGVGDDDCGGARESTRTMMSFASWRRTSPCQVFRRTAAALQQKRCAQTTCTACARASTAARAMSESFLRAQERARGADAAGTPKTLATTAPT